MVVKPLDADRVENDTLTVVRVRNETKENMMTRKHFKIVADEIAKIEDAHQRAMFAAAVATAFKRINPKFNLDKFYTACNVE